jgi:alpha-amylase/alpha-mannosidase (GH57 family)
MQLDSRIRFLNGDAHEVLSSGSDVMFAGRESTEKVLHPSAHKIEDVDCLFADTPFGWFENLHHDVAWSKEYWQRLCVSAFGALHPNGVFVIRYGGWHTTDIYTSLIDAGFTIPMKQAKLHIQEANLVNRKSHSTCGRGHVNGHFQIIVAYKSNDSKNQHVDNDNWMLRTNKFKNISRLPRAFHRCLTTERSRWMGRWCGCNRCLSLRQWRSSIDTANPAAYLWIYAAEPPERRSPASCWGDNAL